MPEVATPNQGEREFETGSDEFQKAQSELNTAAAAIQDRLSVLNAKRTYDAYQDLDLQVSRQNLIEQTRLNNIAAQALQNAIETANLAGKSYLEHNNLAHDSYWNPVSAGTGMNLTAGAIPANRAVDVAAAGTGVSAEAVAAAVAKSVDATITPVLATLQQILQALSTATTSIANVVNQAQPKTA